MVADLAWAVPVVLVVLVALVADVLWAAQVVLAADDQCKIKGMRSIITIGRINFIPFR